MADYSDKDGNKRTNFINQPIGKKSVKALPGVEGILATRLEQAGYDKAYIVFGMYLVLQREEADFVRWFEEVTGSYEKMKSMMCWEALDKWYEAHMMFNEEEEEEENEGSTKKNSTRESSGGTIGSIRPPDQTA